MQHSFTHSSGCKKSFTRLACRILSCTTCMSGCSSSPSYPSRQLRPRLPHSTAHLNLSTSLGFHTHLLTSYSFSSSIPMGFNHHHHLQAWLGPPWTSRRDADVPNGWKPCCILGEKTPFGTLFPGGPFQPPPQRLFFLCSEGTTCAFGRMDRPFVCLPVEPYTAEDIRTCVQQARVSPFKRFQSNPFVFPFNPVDHSF